jgi:hypothetical protein
MEDPSMLPVEDTKMKALVFFRASSLLAAEAFERFLLAHGGRARKSRWNLLLDVKLAIAALHNVARQFDFAFPYAGQLDCLAKALVPELREHSPAPLPPAQGRVATDFDAGLGCWWLQQGIIALDTTLQVCSEEPVDGQVALAAFMSTILCSCIDGEILHHWRHMPTNLKAFIDRHCGFPPDRDADAGGGPDEDDDGPDDPDTDDGPPEMVTAATGPVEQPRTWRFREWL